MKLKNGKSSATFVLAENQYKFLDDILNFEKQLQDDKKFAELFVS